MESPFKGKNSPSGVNILIPCSIEEYKKAFKNESAFRRELYLSLVLIIVGFVIGETEAQKILLVSSIIILLIIEFLSKILKISSDKILFNNYFLSKKIKYVGNATIFLAITNALITWIVILFF
tara:strand:+ start:1583 stop:1951 length:369 start_codon:yes stop_codon:yes gene_type:complete